MESDLNGAKPCIAHANPLNKSPLYERRSEPVYAVAQHFEYEVEVAALARQYYEEEGRPEGRSIDHWLRAEREIRRRMAAPPAGLPARNPGEQ